MPISKKRIKAIENRPEKAIDYSDIPELDDRFFEHARLITPPVGVKKHFTMRLDADVLEWFKTQGRGYQTRINAILRAYMEMHRDKNASS